MPTTRISATFDILDQRFVPSDHSPSTGVYIKSCPDYFISCSLGTNLPTLPHMSSKRAIQSYRESRSLVRVLVRQIRQDLGYWKYSRR